MKKILFLLILVYSTISAESNGKKLQYRLTNNTLELKDDKDTTSYVRLKESRSINLKYDKNALYSSVNVTVPKQQKAEYVPEHLQKDVWIGMGVGAGGYLNGIQAGPTGIIMCNSDLSGTYISRNRGDSWQNIGYFQGLQETHACGMGFDPADSSVFFIGTDNGIYRTDNVGMTFNKVFNGVFCTDIAISVSNHNIGYAEANSKYNTSDGAIYKTTDNGKTWKKVSIDLPVSGIMVQRIIISPANSDTLYIHSDEGRFTTATKALYKSVDGGIHWTEIAPAVLRNEIYDVAIDPTNFKRLYASGSNIGVAKSLDGGITWFTKKAPNLGAIHIKRNMPNIVRVIENWCYRESTDYGETWKLMPSWPVPSTFLPGQKWDAKPRKGEDMSNPDTYFWWNACWAWASFDGAKTIRNIWTKEKITGSGWWTTKGLENAIAWDIVISEANHNILYAGYWDIGMWRSIDHGQTWQSSNNTDLTGGWVWSVDGISKQGVGGNTKSICADPERENVVWATIQGNKTETSFLCKSTDYGKFDSWIRTAGLPETTDISGLSVDYNSPSQKRTLYATANGDIYKSFDDGLNWLNISTGLNCQYTMVDRFNPSYIYSGGISGFYRSVDKGATWYKTGLAEMLDIHDIKIDPSNPKWVYVVCFGSNKGLYLSKDNGQNWIKILVEDYLRGVAIDPINPQNLYVASSSAKGSGGFKVNSRGVMYSRDCGRTWNNANEGIAWPFAWRIAVDPQNPSYVMASLNGQSIKKRQFSDIGTTNDINVKLSRFYTIQNNNNNIKIVWSTMCEIENDHFDILKSKNGFDFKLLSSKKSIGKANCKTTYSIIDSNPYAGGNFYKIVTFKKDKSYKELGIRTLIYSQK